MKLERPLVFLDLETTGPNPESDRVVEFAAMKRRPDGTTTEWETLVNPQVPIPQEATKVHGITDDTVRSAPPFAAIAPKILRALEGCDLAGYNVRRFDVPMLRAEFSRVKLTWSLDGVRVIDAMRIFTTKEPRDLSAALRFFAGEEHVGAHGALADVRATARVLDGQLARYADLPRDVAQLADLCAGDAIDVEGKLCWRGGEVAVGFGQNKGKSLRWLLEHDKGFLTWMMRADFAPEVKRHVDAALRGEFESRPA